MSNVLVSGAGTDEVNGSYTGSGEGQSAIYSMGDYEIYFYTGANFWVIANSSHANMYYSDDGMGNTNPWDSSSWAVIMLGVDPPPTVTEDTGGGEVKTATATCAVSLDVEGAIGRIISGKATAQVDLGLEEAAQALLSGQSSVPLKINGEALPTRLRDAEATAETLLESTASASRVRKGEATAEILLDSTTAPTRVRSANSTVAMALSARSIAGVLRQAAATATLQLTTTVTMLNTVLVSATVGLGVSVAAGATRLAGAVATAAARLQATATGQRTRGAQATATVAAEVEGRSSAIRSVRALTSLLLRVFGTGTSKLWQGTPRAMRSSRRSAVQDLEARAGSVTMKASGQPDMQSTIDPREE